MRDCQGRLAHLFVAIGLLIALSGCATTQSEPTDPLEGLNRELDAVNSHLDAEIIEPVSDAYVEYLPGQLRQGVTNFFDNLGTPNDVLNSFLQGKLGDVISGTGRFVINTTIGLGGFFDPATMMGMEALNEDFGQTLGVYGVDEGAYLVLPLYGPNSTRDVWDFPVSYFTNPLTYFDLGLYTIPLVVIDAIDTRARLATAIKISNEALDPYVFRREGYRQRRIDLIYDGNPPDEELDSLEQAEADAFEEPLPQS
ncbi:MAG: VacJ family lipoprotein [Pseudomonadota bacterium]